MSAKWIDDWRPDDEGFWSGSGKRVARRNLIFSIFAEHLGFTVWTVWSIVAVNLGSYSFADSPDLLFWLVAMPNLVGSLLRIPYTFGPAVFGGRNFTIVSAILLVIPAGMLAVAVSSPHTPYWMFLVIATLAGFGGGNFASSMANISYFYPEKKQGWALGINASGGNIGVSTMQMVIPIVIAGLGLAAAGLVWIPLALAAAVCAFFFMDNLTVAKADPKEQIRIAGKAHTWIMSFLYIGTFGSFIGFSTAFPLLINTVFPERAAWVALAFVGPLVGSVARPLGGLLSDKIGGGRVTLWNFVVMALGVLAIWVGVASHSFAIFYLAFMALFTCTGIGNGSTYRMIPIIYRAKAVEAAGGDTSPITLKRAKQDAAAAIGLISAVGAIGGFFVNRAFGTSLAMSGSVIPALLGYTIFFAACAFVTWFVYVRTAFTQVVRSLAFAKV